MVEMIWKEPPPLPAVLSTAEKLARYSEKQGDCLVWTRGKSHGYGKINVDGKDFPAHRVAWTLTHGDIPPGLVIDHLCHNPGCIRVDHLRPVTRKQNNEHRRGATVKSTTGVRGVFYFRRTGRYQAKVSSVHLGYFPTLAEAEQAAIAGRAKYFTHA